jgi:hypothetical protein
MNPNGYLKIRFPHFKWYKASVVDRLAQKRTLRGVFERASDAVKYGYRVYERFNRRFCYESQVR